MKLTLRDYCRYQAIPYTPHAARSACFTLARQAHARSMRILIVEDDPVLADGLTRSLRHARALPGQKRRARMRKIHVRLDC